MRRRNFIVSMIGALSAPKLLVEVASSTIESKPEVIRIFDQMIANSPKCLFGTRGTNPILIVTENIGSQCDAIGMKDYKGIPIVVTKSPVVDNDFYYAGLTVEGNMGGELSNESLYAWP